MMPIFASAQWYLFPGGSSSQKQQEKQQSSATAAPAASSNKAAAATTAAAPAAKTAASNPAPSTVPANAAATAKTAPAPAPKTVTAPAPKPAPAAAFTTAGPSAIRLTLILPLQASTDKPSENFLGMYGGALMAARDLGNFGMQINVRVIDSAAGASSVSKKDIDGSDVVIGPITYDDIHKTLPLCEAGKYIISPLDPKAESLTGSGNIIQSPVPWSRQIDDLINWLKEDMRQKDNLIVLKDTTAEGNGEQSRFILSQLKQKGLFYRSCRSMDDVNIVPEQNYRVIIASDRDNFITTAVHSVGMAAERYGNITLYSTTRIRNSIGSNVSDLHRANTRLTAAYFVNYNSPEVKNFILAYRALFQAEPDSFAFQGYDTVHYFLTAYSKFGPEWYKKLSDYSEKGLQSDFKFEGLVKGGRINTAVRRIIFHSDLSTAVE